MGSAEHLIGGGAADARRTLTPAVAWIVLLVSTAARAALAVLVVMLLWALVPPAFGLRSTVVMSGSMAPAVQVGDVVVTRTPAPGEIGLGTVVLVEDPDHPDRLRLHRLIGVQDGMLRLRGDANPAPDSSPVAPSALHGVAFLRVPLIGLPITWVQTGDWTAVAAASASASLLLLAAATSRLLPGGGSRPVRRRVAGAAGATAVLLLAVGSASVPAPAWAAFSSATASPPTTFTAGAFDCLTALPSVSGLPASTIAWSFAETSGATSADLGPNGNTARLTGSYDRVSGSCAKNAGPSVRLGTSARGVVAASTPMTSPSNFTLSVWFKADAPSGVIPGGGVIAGFGSNGDGTANSLIADRQLVLNASGTLTYRVDVALGISATITSPVVARDGEWHHAVVTMNGLLGTMAIYVDGGSPTSASVSLSLSGYSAYLRLGADGPGPSADYFRGSIGRTQLWAGTVATGAQALALFNAGH